MGVADLGIQQDGVEKHIIEVVLVEDSKWVSSCDCGSCEPARRRR